MVNEVVGLLLAPMGGDRRLHEPQPTLPGVGDSTPCGPVSSRGIAIFVPPIGWSFVDIWKAFCFGDETEYSPGATDFTNPGHLSTS